MTGAAVASNALRPPHVITNRALVIVASGLLFLPSALFALALRPLPAVLVLAGCGVAMALIVLSAPAQAGALCAPLDRKRLLLCCLCALAILILGGEMHVFYTTWDWLTRDAVLADLVKYRFPSGYRIGTVDYVLRAPLGMYMVPALVGHSFGLVFGHAALLVQNALFLGIIFYFLSMMGAGWRHLAVLILFAGVSIVGAWLRISGGLPRAVPFWLLWGLDGWHPMFQFSGTLVQLFWVPNHALPAWWLATLLLLQTRCQIDIATVGVSIAGALLWSPLCIIGVVPWLVFCAFRRPREILRSCRTWAGAMAALCFVPILIYLISGASSIAGGATFDRPDFTFWYSLFLMVQLPVLLFLVIARSRIAPEDRALLIVSALVLLVLPFFRFGPNNDLVSRGSIVALVVVAFVFGRIVVQATVERSPLGYAGCLLVLCSAPSAAVEIGRAISTPRYAISECSLMEAAHALGETEVPTNYVVTRDALPDWLVETGGVSFRSVETLSCWPDRVSPRYFGTTYSTVSKP